MTLTLPSPRSPNIDRDDHRRDPAPQRRSTSPPARPQRQTGCRSLATLLVHTEAICHGADYPTAVSPVPPSSRLAPARLVAQFPCLCEATAACHVHVDSARSGPSRLVVDPNPEGKASTIYAGAMLYKGRSVVSFAGLQVCSIVVVVVERCNLLPRPYQHVPITNEWT